MVTPSDTRVSPAAGRLSSWAASVAAVIETRKRSLNRPGCACRSMSILSIHALRIRVEEGRVDDAGLREPAAIEDRDRLAHARMAALQQPEANDPAESGTHRGRSYKSFTALSRP